MDKTQCFEVRYDEGVELRPAGLWLEAHTAREFAFISEAMEGTPAAHRRALLTERTAVLGDWDRYAQATPPLLCPFGRAFALGEQRVELLPAGSLPGSSQLLLDGPCGSLLYAGPLHLAGSQNGERPARVHTAQTLVLNAAHTPPAVRAPTASESREALLAFARHSLEADATPVFGAESLALAPELLRILGDAGLRCRVHPRIYRYCRRYRSLGIELRGVQRFRGTPAHEEVLVVPPEELGARAVRSLRKTEIARVIALDALATADALGDAEVLATGPRAPRRFVLALRSDAASLVAYAQELAPRRTYAFGAHADTLTKTLRAAGLAASVLASPRQLPLW